MPAVETKRMISPQSPNHLTVVTKIDIGETSILPGGDLENSVDPDRGWTAVLRSDARTKQLAQLFKIPHHGSENAHSDEVWSAMLIENPYAVLTPWNRSTKLPTIRDVNRIAGATPYAYATAKSALSKSDKNRPNTVTKQLREMGIRLRRSEAQIGGVTFRNGGVADPHTWQVTLYGGAYKLTAVASD